MAIFAEPRSPGRADNRPNQSNSRNLYQINKKRLGRVYTQATEYGDGIYFFTDIYVDSAGHSNASQQ